MLLPFFSWAVAAAIFPTLRAQPNIQWSMASSSPAFNRSISGFAVRGSVLTILRLEGIGRCSALSGSLCPHRCQLVAFCSALALARSFHARLSAQSLLGRARLQRGPLLCCSRSAWSFRNAASRRHAMALRAHLDQPHWRRSFPRIRPEVFRRLWLDASRPPRQAEVFVTFDWSQPGQRPTIAVK